MEFHVYETGETVKAARRPIVFITSNNEKELPDAFLRRCFFHYIKFPDADTMRDIIDVHFPGIKGNLINSALNIFYEIRDVRDRERIYTTGSAKVVWVNHESKKPVPLPDSIRSLLPQKTA